MEGKWVKVKKESIHGEHIILYVTQEDFKESHFIRGWTLYSQVTPNDKKYDFMVVDWKRITSEWGKITIDLQEIDYNYEQLEEDPNKYEIIKKFQENPPTFFHRIAHDKRVTYGDGGVSDLVYPIWVADKLNISERKRLNLLNRLLELNDQRKDFQEGSPIEDIIDPELFPHVMGYAKGNWLHRVISIYSHHRDFYRGEIRTLRQNFGFKPSEEDNIFLETEGESVQIRYSYHWIPSDFVVDANGKLVQMTPIHNLSSLQENKGLYNLISRVFNEMVPMFEKIGVITLGQSNNLQVIVKAQSYNLPPFSSYSGRWHIEGATENIVAVGVYYIQVDNKLEGGKLKFRPDNSPDSYYLSTLDLKTVDVELETPEGSCVVFSNILPHRCRKIKNNTADPLRRTFLTFFVVDPSFPLSSTACIQLGKIELSIYLRKSVREQTGGKFIDQYVLAHIFSYLDFLPKNKNTLHTLEQAKQFRAKSRKAKTLHKSGWGYIHYGNCGMVEFGENEYLFRQSHSMYERDKMHHTDSP